MLYQRRLAARLTAIVFLCAAACGSKETCAAPDKSPRPNVLLITSEDNGPDLGCYGDRFARTPHLDRLAAQGARFERAFVATASCSESRAALLTGLYPHQNGQIGLASHHYRMFGEVPNIASRLKARGYRTGLIGKLHVKPESAFPFDFRPDVSQINVFARRDVERVADLANEFFSAADGPFFLMVNYADAHLPFLRQQHGLPRTPLSGDDVRPLPWIGIDTPRLRETQADYYNCIMRMDEGVGRLLAALDRAGLTKKTLVIYLGDHGAQFPRGKLASYESSLRVPLMVRFPGRISPAIVRNELVSTLDVLPTILEFLGKRVPRGLPGRSLLPLMSDAAVKTELKPAWRNYLVTEYHGHYPPIYFPQRTIRDQRYKLIVNLLQDRANPVAEVCSQKEIPFHPPYVTPADIATADKHVQQAYKTWHNAPPVELYDLQSDPREWRNRAADPSLADIQARLLGELKQWQQRTSDPLADRAKLDRLTAEHDALEKPYRRPKASPFHYTEYLAQHTAPANAKAPFDVQQAKVYQAKWAQHLGMKVESINSLGTTMVLIPPGEFLMGSSDAQVEAALKVAAELKIDQRTQDRIRTQEQPQHTMKIAQPFLLAATEVTIAQFRKFVEATDYLTEADVLGTGNSAVPDKAAPKDRNDFTWRTPGFVQQENAGVSQVSWNDAVTFCNWLSRQEKLTQCYRKDAEDGWTLIPENNGYRLPNEAQWEFACRAGTTGQYHFGDDYRLLEKYDWYGRIGKNATRTVGTKLPNAFGLYNMHGNVGEWCQDFYDPNFYQTPRRNDPTGPANRLLPKSRRVIRGGDWWTTVVRCRSAFRGYGDQVTRSDDLGFRLMRSLK